MEHSVHRYENGDRIPQIWNYWFILYAFILAFVSSFAFVRLLDHHAWRSEKEKQYASSVIIKRPNMIAAWILGFGTVWSMHFTGMSAVSLDRTPMCYHWPYTILSLACAILFIWAGVVVAKFDIFAGEDRVQRLKAILIHKPNKVSQTKDHKSASRQIYKTAFFDQLHWILMGSLLAATGALTMHYTGMQAMNGPFRLEWKIEYLAGSTFIAIAVCFVGFWIVFRLLHWKVERFWLRPVSAAVIAVAVCGLHFFGMLSVEYIADDTVQGDTCYDRIVRTHVESPNAWDDHQILVAGVSALVPTIALFVENVICRELLMAYANLKDPSLTGCLFDDETESNRTSDRIKITFSSPTKTASKTPQSVVEEDRSSLITAIDRIIGKEKEGSIDVVDEKNTSIMKSITNKSRGGSVSISESVNEIFYSSMELPNETEEVGSILVSSNAEPNSVADEFTDEPV